MLTRSYWSGRHDPRPGFRQRRRPQMIDKVINLDPGDAGSKRCFNRRAWASPFTTQRDGQQAHRLKTRIGEWWWWRNATDHPQQPSEAPVADHGEAISHSDVDGDPFEWAEKCHRYIPKR